MKRQSLWLKIFKNIPSNFYPNSSKSIDLNATFQDGRTAFMVACEKGNLNIEERDFVWFSNTVKCCLKIGEFMKHQVFLKMCMVWQIITILPRFLKSFFSQHFQTECVMSLRSILSFPTHSCIFDDFAPFQSIGPP